MKLLRPIEVKFSSTSTVLTIVTPGRVSAPIMRYSDSRKSARKPGASAISKPASESITSRLPPISLDRVDDLVHRLVDREVERPEVDES